MYKHGYQSQVHFDISLSIKWCSGMSKWNHISTIRKMLFEHKKGKWIEELPIAVWPHNMTKSRAMKFTPFRLLYGTEANKKKDRSKS